jgi:hypothetical protein
VTRRARYRRFWVTALACALIDLAASLRFASFDTGVRFSEWWWLLPILACSALIVQPAWGCVVAGVAAGGVIGDSVDGNAIVTAGINWNAADIFTAVGLLGTAVLLAVRLVRIFPTARTELRQKRLAKAPANV